MTIEPTITWIARASEEHPRHSEATIAELSDGSLMIVWQEYTASAIGSGDNAPNRLASMISRDGGLTWGEHRVLVEREPGDVNVYSPSLLRMPDGELLFFYFRYLVLEKDKPTETSGFVCRSIDDGRTFSEPVAVWTRQPFSIANSTLRRLNSGRLTLPVIRQLGAVWSPTDHYEGVVILSDDGGYTWRLSESRLRLPMRGVMEPHIAQMRDGRLLMVMRTQLGTVFCSTSEDSGETWSPPQPSSLRAPESCPDLVSIPRTGDLLVVWNNAPYDPTNSHYGLRTPLTVAVSSDGETWTHIRDVETDPGWAYSNPACFITSTGSVVLTYWAHQYGEARGGARPISLKAAIFDARWLYEGN